MAAPVELPVGPAVDSTPALFPGAVTLQGRTGAVERLSAARHRAALWTAMRGHDAIWTYLPPGPFSDPAEFDAYIAECEQNKERIFYAVVDSSGRAVIAGTTTSPNFPRTSTPFGGASDAFVAQLTARIAAP